MRKIVVQKYGGTSVGDTDKIKNVAKRIVRYRKKGCDVVVVVSALGDSGIDWEIVLVNDGSIDKTGKIAAELASKEPRIRVTHHERPRGIGYCFREGIESSSKDAITWLPGDGENDPYELLKYLPILEHVEIVIPFVLNVGIRSWGRRPLGSRLRSDT